MAAKRGSFEDKLEKIHALGREAPARAEPELLRFLQDANAYLVAEASKVVVAHELRSLGRDLERAFLHWIKQPAMSDKNCHAKKRLVEALIALEVDARAAYYAGLKYEQLEFSVGPPVDTAAPLRGLCANALVHLDVPGAIFDVTPLLFDSCPEARLGAAEALRYTGEPLCAALLHAKVCAGDGEADVLGACYRGMLALEPRRYLPVVEEALVGGLETAALALGESRLPEALGALKRALESGNPEIETTTLLAIALCRSEEANALLMELIEGAPESRAVSALAALALHRHDPKIAARVREIVGKRRSKRLARLLEEKFGAA